MCCCIVAQNLVCAYNACVRLTGNVRLNKFLGYFEDQKRDMFARCGAHELFNRILNFMPRHLI